MGFIASAQIGDWGWTLMWAAGASRVAQQAHYEGARRQYSLGVYGKPRTWGVVVRYNFGN